MLKGERIQLRALEPVDIDLLYEWENDTDNWDVSHTILPFSRKILEDFINSDHDIFINRQYRFVISTNEGKAVGMIDLFEFDPVHMNVGVGVMVDPSVRGKGFASEALELLKDYCYNHLRLKNMYCHILENNQGSIKLFEGAGFKRNGVKEKWVNTREGWQDEYFYQLKLNE